MKKRILTMAAALVTALTCVCACGGGETSQSQNSGNSAAEYDLEYAMAITSLEAGNEISPLIYGEFLEHIPGCVYGVIWAEMLEDRKFYYPAGEEGLSPWKTKGGVTSDSECYSLNGYAAVLEKGGEISQEVVFSEKAYAGYFYGSGDGKIEADIGGVKKEFEIEGEFKKYAFEADSAAEGKRKVTFSCTEGSVKLDSFSLMPADNYRGMRRDTLDAMKALAGTIYRWPGGNFVSGYCWKDGIGDRDKRASLRNQAWFPETGNIEDDKKRLESGFYGRIEPNDMGTDEFMAMCEYIGTIPYMAVNTGSGTKEEAAQLVEYCNGDSSTPYGAMRAQNGREKPYGIRYWCVGNEMQGDWQIGHTSVSNYVQIHNAFVDAMREADEEIVVTGCGDNCSEWTEEMFKNCAGRLDYIAEHLYAVNDKEVTTSLHMLSMTNNLDMRIENHRRLIAEIPAAKNVKIAFDEYAYQWNAQSTMRDALGIASALNLFIQNADVVGMANYSDAVFSISTANAPGALYASEHRLVFSPIGYVLQAYAQHMQPYAAEMTIRQTDKTTGLNYQATVSKDGKTLAIAVANPSEKTIALTWKGQIGKVERQIEVVGKTPASMNNFAEEDVERTETEAPAQMVLQPVSVNVFVIQIG